MKKIILVRHAKSAWDNPLLNDHDRPLAPRGLRDAPKMAKRLSKGGIEPDLILCSTAKRAVQTAEIFAREMGYKQSEIELKKNFYHASENTLLKYIHLQNDTDQTIMLVGHNPGFNDLISLLGGEIDNLPTSGIFGFKVNCNHWKEFSKESVTPWFVDYPKKNSKN